MKSVVLLSGGLDSTVNLFQAVQKTQVVLVLTFNYGQRAALKEIESATQLCRHLNVPHQVISLPWVKDFGGSSLLDSSRSIPQGKDVAIEDVQKSHQTAAAVWVPNRNGIFLNIAAGFAEALKAEIVIPGFNYEEAQTFPDNSGEFLQAITQSLFFSTANHVRAQCYTTALDKTQMLQLALNLKVPLDLLWPCYFAEERWCGQCESCLRFKRALSNHQLLSTYQTSFI